MQDWLPPGLRRPVDHLAVRLERARFQPMSSWQEAVQRSVGYETLSRFPAGVPWLVENEHRSQTEMQFVAALGVCSQAIREGLLTVIDLGGGFGHYYGVATASFPGRSWRWCVCETPTVVALGRESAAPKGLDWALRDEVSTNFDIGVASGVLQYLPDPEDALRWLGATCRFLILNRLPLWDIPCNGITVQRADGVPAYPAWFLSRPLFEEAISDVGTVLLSWDCFDDRAYFKGQRRTYSGMVIKTHA